ncbi:MAG: DinB family protein [Anaerolineae bacterium]|nr:DinB family protein [Anaerolineae bacterium]
MLDMGDPFSKTELLEAFRSSNQTINDYFGGLAPDDFFAHPPEVWSAGENLQHLVLSGAPITKAVLIPREKLSKRFGLADRPSRRYGEVRDQYRDTLATGLVVAPTQYVPVLDELPADKEAGKAYILAAWKETSDGLTTHLEGWTEAELDTYQLPHLLFGMMTMREMLFFTLYHNLHHLEDARRLVDAKQG